MTQDRPQDHRSQDRPLAGKDREAASDRESALKAAADSLSAKRAAEDDQVARRRVAEDEALADQRLAEDREVASTLNRVNVASAAVQAAADGGNIDVVRSANDELQIAVRAHLSAVPEPLPARGPDDIGGLIARIHLAASLTAQGKHAEAEAEYRDLLAVRAAGVQPS